ncbi:MAG: alpha-glucosidase [Bacteroidetes bacterium]|nr:MAG: alpha-glucosidase [Bacteroidota bacterium]
MVFYPKWWKEQVIYQIYPRSFNDSNNDGIGDIPGIIEKLDYLKELGVDIIWLSPIYPSPNDDNGYDISNYRDIHPEFGTMQDFDRLLGGIHNRGMKLIMDLVVNHSSDEHQWFEKSRQSTDNPYRDFYIWKKGQNDGPPNNWQSFFGGSAWQYDEQTAEYYLHLFTTKQPDFNWENPQVRAEIYDLVKFWLDKGIDGFRMDVISLISKRLEFEDTPHKAFGDTVQYVYSNGPRVHEFIHEMYEKVLSHYDIMTIGEGPGISPEVGLKYVGHDRGELNMIFHLDHMFLGFGPGGRFDQEPYGLTELKKIFSDWYEAMGPSGWISIFLDNHDFVRMVSRFGNDQEYRVESAKLLATLVMTMRGTPCIYQGSEIGMTNVNYDSIDDFRDVETLNFHKILTQKGMSQETFLELANKNGRDNVRTPMQWDEQVNGGFCDSTPWIKVNPNFSQINVKKALADKNSIFYFYQKLLEFRKGNDTLIYGHYEDLSEAHDTLFIYKRWSETKCYTILLNFSDLPQDYSLEDDPGKLILSNYMENNGQLAPWEARIYEKS